MIHPVKLEEKVAFMLQIIFILNTKDLLPPIIFKNIFQ